MKYKLGMQTVEAVYDNNGTQNPLIEALPECLGPEQFIRQIKCCPPPPQACQSMSMTERRQGLGPAAHGVRALAVYVLHL